MKQISRRGLLAAVGVAGPLALAAQETPAAAPSTREEDLKSARDAIERNRAQLAGVEVPMSVEPAFVFKA